MCKGFIRLPRRLFETQWWNKRRVWSESDAIIDLYQQANARDRTEPDGTKVLRNQFVTSNRTLADKWYWPPMKVNRFLKKLEDEGWLKVESNKFKTVITIIDFGVDIVQSDTPTDTHGDTPSDTPTDTPKPLYTKGFQKVSDTPTDTPVGTHSGTQSDTYINNNKEYNNNSLFPLSGETLSKQKRFVKPTIEEIDSYIKEKGYNFSAEEFFYFYESKGWVVGKSPMKSWKAACVTWSKQDMYRRGGASKQVLRNNSQDKFDNDSW